MNENGPNKSENDLDLEDFGQLLNHSSEEASGEGGAPEWMATFSDLMTLLMVFFILLFSMSSIEVKKFAQAAQSLKDGFGESTVTTLETSGADIPEILQVDTTSAVAMTIQALEQILIDQKLQAIQDTLQEFIEENDLTRNVRVEKAPPGVTLTLQDVVLFESGEGVVSRENQWILEKLSPVLRDIQVPFTVVGHSDTIPIHNSRFESNWELSSVRAGGVARELLEHGIPAGRIHVEAWADQKPVGDNETVAGRAQNRRVEIFFGREEVRQLVESNSELDS